MNTRRRRKLGEERREHLGEKLVACDVLGSGFSSSRLTPAVKRRVISPHMSLPFGVSLRWECLVRRRPYC